MTASIAGSLQAGFIGSVVPKDYSFINSINVLIIVVFGGLGSITGAIVAAIVLGILNMLLQDVASVRMIIYAFGLSTRYDLQTRWSSWDLGIEPITSL